MTINLSFQTPTTATANLSADGDKRTLSGLAVPFGVASNPSQDGHRYRFSGPPTNADDLVDVVQEHDPDALVGRLAAWTEHDGGMDAAARLFATSRGNDVLTEYHEGARTGFSVSAEIADFTEGPDGVRDVGAGRKQGEDGRSHLPPRGGRHARLERAGGRLDHPARRLHLQRAAQPSGLGQGQGA